MEDKCAIRVQFYDKSKYIILSRENIANWKIFVRAALIEFRVDPESGGDVILWDQNGTEIPEDVFDIIILQYLNCNSFSIRLGIRSDPNEPLLVQELKYFLLQNGGRGAFIEAETDENGNQNLSDETVQFITGKLMSFIDLNYSMHRWNDIEDVCKAAVILFPCIALDRLFDLRKKKGTIYNKICYIKYRKPAKKQKEKTTTEDEYGNENAVETDDTAADDIDELSYLLYFKTCIVDRELDILKIKLTKTIEMRELLIKKKDTQFHKTFPFYFIEPSLVLFDFEIRQISPSPNALLDKWDTVKREILICVNASERDNLLQHFSEDIGYFLALLKLFASNRSNLDEIIRKFIVYTDDVNSDPKAIMDETNQFPYLMAIGEQKNDIKCYYIAIEKQIIPLPTTFKFKDVFDLYFKIHQIFNMKYHPNLKNMMVFMEHFIYEIEGSVVSTTVSKIGRKIFKK